MFDYFVGNEKPSEPMSRVHPPDWSSLPFRLTTQALFFGMLTPPKTEPVFGCICCLIFHLLISLDASVGGFVNLTTYASVPDALAVMVFTLPFLL